MTLNKLYILNSDNFDNDVLLPSEYNIVKLQMSTGDFHTHKVTEIFVTEDDFEDFIDENCGYFIEDSEV